MEGGGKERLFVNHIGRDTFDSATETRRTTFAVKGESDNIEVEKIEDRAVLSVLRRHVAEANSCSRIRTRFLQLLRINNAAKAQRYLISRFSKYNEGCRRSCLHFGCCLCLCTCPGQPGWHCSFGREEAILRAGFRHGSLCPGP